MSPAVGAARPAAGHAIREARAGLAKLESEEVVLIDTPGVGPRDQARFARLASLLRAIKPDESHLVLQASLSPTAQGRLARGFEPLAPSRVVLTHMDEVVGLGVILNAVDRLRLGVSYLATGQSVPQDLQRCTADEIATMLAG